MSFEELAKLKLFHFVGVGGSGMSSLASFLLKQKIRVSGCDLFRSDTVRSLENKGLLFLGEEHSPEHIEDADVVVFSSAVPPDTHELIHAREKGKIVVKRIELLAEILKLKKSVAVIGSHGKTTTTTMIAHILHESGRFPLAIIGGVARDGSEFTGEGEIAVVEIDESDRDFMKITPFVVVITNLDREHEDRWGGFEGLKKAFIDFANSVPLWGFVVVNFDDPGVKDILPYIRRKVIRCSVSSCGVDFYASNLILSENTMFDVVSGGGVLTFSMKLPGMHNVQNALLSISTSLLLGAEPQSVMQAVSKFSGVKRRLDIIAKKNGVTIVDDYAHHPTEIHAAFSTLELITKGNIYAIFEPHRFSRTYSLKDDFARVLKRAEKCIITDIYGASEKNIWGIRPHDIVEKVPNAFYVPMEKLHEEAKRVFDEARDGDVILFMGAGRIKEAEKKFLELIL